MPENNCIFCGIETCGSTSNIPICFECYEKHNQKDIDEFIKKNKETPIEKRSCLICVNSHSPIYVSEERTEKDKLCISCDENLSNFVLDPKIKGGEDVSGNGIW